MYKQKIVINLSFLMKQEKSLITVAELDALIANWGSDENADVDKFYTARLTFNVLVMLPFAIALLFYSTEIAQNLSSDPNYVDRVEHYLYFRGWFILLIIAIGAYSYLRSWYTAIYFSFCLVVASVNFVSDLFILFPEHLAHPTPYTTLSLIVRLILILVMYISVKNASRMPDAKDRLNPFLMFKRDV